MADNNGSAFATLERMVASIRSFPDIAKEAMPEVAARVDAAWRADLAAGRDPETGATWAATKDGGRAMAGAAGAGASTVSGTSITLSMGAPHAFHHYGVRGAEPRHVVPTGSAVPIKFGNAVRLGLTPVWHEKTRVK